MVGTTHLQSQQAAKSPLQPELVRGILSMLSAEERLALVMRHTRHLKLAEMAHALSCTPATARRLLAQAEAKVHTAQRALIEALIEVKPTRRVSRPNGSAADQSRRR